ncbi:hypothetical protein EDC18_102397 [Natranaerovirga pectinivora]|uniref:Uncharacterized protein n=1 Tax=Natranaerovirga pectinivora TaxID=682400 RepID=A0A4R3MSF9_9FIRM|nr:hypothetical protein [Natranaerovirga pectinivora]TCT16378.1 hypothetical protein EDC18_102397 [Natranaerovirga pectinivora]
MSIFKHNNIEINKSKKELKIHDTIEDYAQYISKHSKVHNKQIEFATKVTNRIYDNEDKSKVDVITARCGIGKSALIKALLSNLVNNYLAWGELTREDKLDHYGAIVVTDRLDRLEEIDKHEEISDRCYFMKYDKENTESKSREEFIDQLREQQKYPIVLISTQKYFRMSKKDRDQLYNWNNGTRQIVLIDEKPILFNPITINEKFISNIRIALDNCVESEQKNYLMDTFNKIENELNAIKKDYSSKYDVMWFKKSKETLLYNEEVDKEFFDILQENVSSTIYDNVLRLKQIYTDGCLFVNKKNKDQENTRNFILIESNVDKFETDKFKYYIFDATALNDKDYDIDKQKFNIVQINDTKKIKDINLYHIPVSTSQLTLLKKNYYIDVISKWINDNFKNDIFVATYGEKKGIFQRFNTLLNTNKLAYFGNIKGNNDWKEEQVMAHIGFNRQADTVYLQTYIYLNKKNEDWNIKDNNTIKKEIEELLCLEKGFFTNIAMCNIMKSQILVDTEQNIMRIKCRQFSNEEVCKIYIFASDDYTDYITRLRDKLKTNYKKFMPDQIDKEMAKHSTKNKKPPRNKEKTNPQVFLEWTEKQSKNRGRIIKFGEIARESGLTKEALKEVRKSNSYAKKWFDDHKGNKNGEYIA